MKTIILMITLIIPSFVAAQNVPDCATDYRGTTRSTGAPVSVDRTSLKARYQEDWRNAAVNFYFQDSSGIAIRDLLVRDTWFSTPMCNEIGQCFTAQIKKGGYAFGLTAGPIGTSISLGTKDFAVRVEFYSGNYSSIYVVEAANMDTQRQLPIPATGGTPDQKCKFNTGEFQDPELNQETGGGDNDTYDDYEEQYYDEEESYGGIVPRYVCGNIVTPEGQVNYKTCGWFWD